MSLPAICTFSHAISLGTHCYTAGLLQRAGLRKFSGPFDWIFSNSGVVRHCIETDFEILLDQSYYEPVPVESRPAAEYYRCHHNFYRENYGTEYMFNHHDVCSEDDYAYLKRCVTRFRLAQAQGAVLGVQARWDQLWNAEKEFAETADCLERHAPNIVLCAFTVRPHRAAGPKPTIEQIACRGPHALYALTRVGEWYATAFELAEDEQLLIDILNERSFALQTLDGIGPE